MPAAWRDRRPESLSQGDQPEPKLLQKGNVQRNERMNAPVIEVDYFSPGRGFIAFQRQIVFLWSESGCLLDIFTDAQEQWMGVLGQVQGQMAAKRRNIEVRLNRDCSHPRPAFCLGYGHAIDDRFRHSGEPQDHRGDLPGGYVLAFPAKSIADTVDEVEVTALIFSHQIAGSEPCVSFRKDVAKELPARRVPVGISLEPASRKWIVSGQFTQRLACFALGATDAKAVVAPRRFTRVDVKSDDGNLRAIRKKWRNPANCARLPLAVVERESGFGRRVEFKYPRDTKSLLELLPYVGAEPIAAAESKHVVGFVGMWGAVKKVAAKLADILEQRAVPFDHIAPKLAGRELRAD